jgi:hypothetical protein
VERCAPARYRRVMPNRKTFDPREKYDHSGRPLEHAQKNDLQPDIREDASTAKQAPTPASPDKRGPRAPR